MAAVVGPQKAMVAWASNWLASGAKSLFAVLRARRSRPSVEAKGTRGWTCGVASAWASAVALSMQTMSSTLAMRPGFDIDLSSERGRPF